MPQKQNSQALDRDLSVGAGRRIAGKEGMGEGKGEYNEKKREDNGAEESLITKRLTRTSEVGRN